MDEFPQVGIRAERSMGQILIEMEKAGEIAGKGGDRKSDKIKVAHDDFDKQKTLHDLAITKDQSSRYKALANAPDEAFESAIGSTASKPTPRGSTSRALGCYQMSWFAHPRGSTKT